MSALDEILRALRETGVGAGEAALSLGSGMAAAPVAGIAGLGQLVQGKGLGAATARINKLREAMTYAPRTDIGQRGMENIGGAIEPIAAKLRENIADPVGERSPFLGAALVAGGEMLGPKGAKPRLAKPQAFVADPNTVPRTLRDITAVTGVDDADIARSTLSHATAQGDATVPRAGIEQALERRAVLRSERPTTPGADATPEQWAAWGQKHGVNMTATPSQSLGISDLTSRREITVPGGLEGKFTIPDLFQIKANNFDPGALPKEVHDALMQKFLRTYERPGGAAPVDKFNALNFALTSPNAPLTQNQFVAARTRVRTPEELATLAARKGEPDLSATLAEEAGVRGARHGGMGTLGTADLGNQADLAAAVRGKPEMFDIAPGETMREVAARTMNQVPGLGPKTASLGVPWTDLNRANVSAVDLHMIRNSYQQMLTDPQLGPDFRKRMIGLLRMRKGATADQIMERPGAEAAAIKIIGGDSKAQVYRDVKGNLKGGARPELAPEKLMFEPKTAQDFNPFYNRVLDYINTGRGENPQLALFPEQWRKWDTYRQRVEPHEQAHPDFTKLPKQSFNEQQAALQAHKDAGYMGQAKAMKPSDWRKLYYGNTTVPFAATLAGGSGAAALVAQRLRKDEEEQPKKGE